MRSAASSISASATRISRNPVSSMNGRRSAASSGGRIAFRTAITAAATSAPRKPLTARARDDPRRDEQRGRGHDPRDEEVQRPELRPARPPARRVMGLFAAGDHRRSRLFRESLRRASSEGGDEGGRAGVFDLGGRGLSGLTWLGHSTVVIDVDGTRLVTDPVLRRRVWHLRRESADRRRASRRDPRLAHALRPPRPRLAPPLRPVVARRRAEGRRQAAAGLGVLAGARGRGRGRARARGVTMRATHAEHESSRGPFSARSASLGYVVEGPDDRLLRGRHRPLRRHGRARPASTWRSCRSPAGARGCRPATSTRAARPRPCACCGRGWRCRSTGARSGRRSPPSPTTGRRGSSQQAAAELAPEVDVRVLAIGETLALEAAR